MPGSRHAKNNTALGYFTRHERESLGANGWGSQKQRLNKDSIKAFYACTVCLKCCDTPLLCPSGDIFCKQCIYSHLLAQKQKTKQLSVEYQQHQHTSKQTQSHQQRKDAVQKFIQMDTTLQSMANKKNDHIDNSVVSNHNNHKNHKNTKQNDLRRQEHDKKLSCFWIPALAPDAAPKELKAPDTNTYCPGCNKTLRMKQLIRCEFTMSKQDVDSTSGVDRTSNKSDALFECGSCAKTLTNTIKCGCLAKCGHILCLQCIKTIVAETKCCSVCDEPCTKKKHIVMLSSGGTGFAAHGNQIEVTKKAVAFQ